MELFQINAPRKDHRLFRIHPKGNRLVARDASITDKKSTPFQCVTRHPSHPPVTVCFLHQVISPGHAEERTKSAQRRKERAGLNGTGMDEVGLDLPNDASKVQRQTRQVTPAKLASAACPQDLLNILGDRAIFDLPALRLQF